MIKRLLACASAACAIAVACAAFAQTQPIVTAPAVTAVPTTAMAFGAQSSSASFVTDQTPLPSKMTVLAATSTAQIGSVTSSGVTPTSGAATFSGGTATIGPLAPQLGRPIRVVLTGTWTGTFKVGTSASACATFNPLTVGGQPWASYTANINEDVDVPMISVVVYCAQATVTSGTLNYAVRQ
jgi:hypothetical protein